MRIGVDARHLDAGRGVAVYLEGMLGALTGDELRLLVPGRAPLGPAGLALGARPDVSIIRTRAPGRALFGSAALTGEPTLARLLGDVDVLWIPAPAPVAPGPVPYVLTVHDLSFARRPEDFTGYERVWHRMARPRALALGAARVVTDTATVAAELRAAWGLERVAVVAPGVRRRRGGAAPEREYVLFVGALEPRKDPLTVVRGAAAAGVAADFAGDGRLAAEVRAAGGAVHGHVPDAELAARMRGALALVLPSRLEGFGFPPLEAALLGTPSIVSDLPVLREVLGDDGALFVPAGDAGAVAAAIRRLRADPVLGAQLSASAAARARSWDAAAADLRAVFAETTRVRDTTVVVVLHDSAAELAVLLASIERCLADRPELVVVDTGSRDGGAELAERHGARVVRLPGNPGFGAANVAGLAEVRTPVTVLLNPDVELLDGGLVRLVELAARHDALHAPRLLNADGSIQRSAHPVPGTAAALLPALVHPRLLPRRARLAADPWRADRPRRVGWAIAAAIAARTATLRRLGPFDPDAFLFFEDLELCLRGARAGVPTVLHPDIALRHAGGHSTGPAYGGEPHELMARRRREVIAAHLGRRALALDDLAQGLTFATRAAAHGLSGRRERAQLRALISARHAPPHGRAA